MITRYVSFFEVEKIFQFRSELFHTWKIRRVLNWKSGSSNWSENHQAIQFYPDEETQCEKHSILITVLLCRQRNCMKFAFYQTVQASCVFLVSVRFKKRVIWHWEDKMVPDWSTKSPEEIQIIMSVFLVFITLLVRSVYLKWTVLLVFQVIFNLETLLWKKYQLGNKNNLETRWWTWKQAVMILKHGCKVGTKGGNLET